MLPVCFEEFDGCNCFLFIYFFLLYYACIYIEIYRVEMEKKLKKKKFFSFLKLN